MQDTNPWESDRSHPTMAATTTVSKKITRTNASDIDLRRLLALWPWVIVSILLATIAAFTYLRYAVPVYQSTIQVSMKGDDQALNLGTSSIFDTRNPLNDKIDLLKAPTTVLYVVDSLNLEYSAVLKGKIKDRDLYKRMEWRILNANTPLPYTIIVKPQDNHLSFKWEKDGLTGTARWGQVFAAGKDSLVMYAFQKFDADDQIVCTKVDALTTAFTVSNKIKVIPGNQSNSVFLTYDDILKERANDVLSTVIAAYNQLTIDYKSKSLVQSLNFMHQRIAPLSTELDSIETALAGFKSSKGIVGDAASGSLYLEKTAQLDAQANAARLQREIFQAVENYINNPNLKEENLSLVGLNDSYLQGLVGQFQMLLKEKERLAVSLTPENPKYQFVEAQLQQTRGNIMQQLRNYRSTVNMQEANVNAQLNQAQAMLRGTPANEKLLLEKQRQQNIKQSLFLLLLQKKEEASIALASTTSDVRLLAPARAYSPISPKPLLVYGIAMAIGLLLPLTIGIGREVLNNKITSKAQLEQMLSAPVIASIDQSVDEEEKLAIVSMDDRSVTAEQIRALRSALRFYSVKGKPLVLLTTSSYSGEGKTFISGNLAKSYALQGLKVALLEFDMRKPKLARRMGINNKQGLSTVLMGLTNPADIFVNDAEAPNLHLYPTGAIPPNPSELIAMAGMETLKQYLLAHYDVVVIDTPPFGLVADAQMLAEWVDVSLVVVRFNVTPREQVREIENWNQQHKLGKMAVVLNGVKTEGYYGYNYTPYYYRRKYGYEYYSNPTPKGKKKK